MSGHTVILDGSRARDAARRLIGAAPAGSVVTVRAATRSTDQNALMWSLLTDLSRQKPQGKRHTPDNWKAIAMNAAGHHVQFLEGIDGQPFPAGFRSSKLTKRQMTDLIEVIFAYGDEHGVKWTLDPREREAA